MRKFILLGFAGAILLGVLSGCSVFEPSSDLQPEALLPADSSVVVVADVYDGAQRSAFRDVVKELPEDFLAGFEESEVVREGMGELMSGKWKIVVGQNEDGLYYAGKVNEISDFEEMLEERFGKSLKYFEGGDAHYFSAEGVGFYAVTYKDLFFVCGSAEERSDAVKRLIATAEAGRDGEGFAFREYDGAGYFYSDGELLVGLEMGFSFEDEGVRFDFGEEVVVEGGVAASLAGRVPGEGLIAYSEGVNLAGRIEDLWVRAQLDGSANGGGEVQNLLRDGLVDDLYKYIAGFGDLTVSEAKVLTDKPYGFAVYGGGVPRAALFVDLGLDKDLGKKFVISFDKYMDEVIEGFDSLVRELAGGSLVKETVLVKGGGFHRVFVDWDEVSDDAQDKFVDVLGSKLLGEQIEVYYGVTGDGFLVISFYPDFGGAVLGSSVEMDEGFVAARGRINTGDEFAYVRMGEIVEIFRAAIPAGSGGYGIRDKNGAGVIDGEMLLNVLELFEYVVVSGKEGFAKVGLR